MNSLTSDQETFLEECNLEFSERYTISDPEFKMLFEAEIPIPPIVFPWHGRSRFNNWNRDRGGFHRNDSVKRGYDRDNSGSYDRDRRETDRGGERYVGYRSNHHRNEDRRDYQGASHSNREYRRFNPY